MRYEGAVYRPPSEASSLIVQMTIGCARNTCTFCYMFKDKRFRVRPMKEVVEDLEFARKHYGTLVRRVFLADGDALVCKTKDILYILNTIRELFPWVERVAAYGAPRDVLLKSPEELRMLKEAGLDLVYIGAESGNDQVLEAVKKQATSAEIIEGCLRLKEAGIGVSITLISGLGSRELFKEHVLDSAKLISAIKPEYVSYLTLMLEPGTELYRKHKAGEFDLLTAEEVAEEMLLFLENTDSEGSIFRSNHASNYVALAGTLNKDTPKMIEKLKQAIANRRYRPDMFRGL